TEGGLFRREIRFTSNREFITTLVGSAQAPISAEPSKIELRHGPDTAVRTGAFEIVNRTGEPLTFALKGSPRLQVPESVAVAAHGRTAIAVSTRAEDVTDLDEELRIESAGFSLGVPVRAIKVGPILRLSQPALALGRIDAARGAQATIDLQNVGGTPAKVTGEIGAPFVLNESAFELAPGEKKQITLVVRTGQPQRYRAWLKFKAGNTNAELEVDAELIGDATAKTAAKAKPKPVEPSDLPPWSPDMNIAKAILARDITATSAKIEWPAEMSGAVNFRLERQILTRDSARQLRDVWMEIPNTKIDRRGPLWIASLTGLHPAQSHTVRIVPLTSTGRAGQQLFRLDFFTLPARSLPKPPLIPTLLIALLVTMGILIWKRVRQQRPVPLEPISTRGVAPGERIALRPFQRRP
ncbi:MAG TPA: fibronectin type III domain-containing protein, partial [Chthoniobacteraceae bacterium]|nr:fibronectin type III domain-containing protein [Chthoniobacteraceae bacterium]